MFFNFNKEEFKYELVDDGRFRLVYSSSLNVHLMLCSVPWIVDYERFYFITEDEYNLYKTNKEDFFKRFKRKISSLF